jgi:Holliday junction resolvase
MPRTFTTEKDVKAEVRKLLARHGWFWWMPGANGFGAQGVADFLALRGGVFMAVETKFGKNRPSHLQRAFLESVAVEGGFAFVVTEKTLPAFAAFLLAFDAAIAASGGQKVQVSDNAALLDATRVLTEAFVENRE